MWARPAVRNPTPRMMMIRGRGSRRSRNSTSPNTIGRGSVVHRHCCRLTGRLGCRRLTGRLVRVIASAMMISMVVNLCLSTLCRYRLRPRGWTRREMRVRGSRGRAVGGRPRSIGSASQFCWDERMEEKKEKGVGRWVNGWVRVVVSNAMNGCYLMNTVL